MLKNVRLGALSFILLFFFPIASLPQKNEAKPNATKILSAVESSTQKSPRIRAAFTQSYTHHIFKKKEVSKGTLFFEKPAHMRWDYESPTRKSFIFDANTITLIRFDTEETTLYPCLSNDILNYALPFMLGKGELLKTFELVQSEWHTQDQVRYAEITLKPKVSSHNLKRISLLIDVAQKQIRASTLIDAQNNVNYFKFESLDLNPTFNRSIFKERGPSNFRVSTVKTQCKS